MSFPIIQQITDFRSQMPEKREPYTKIKLNLERAMERYGYLLNEVILLCEHPQDKVEVAD